MVSDHQGTGYDASFAKNGDGPANLRTYRPGLFLHIHDGGGRWRKESCRKEVPRRICTSTKGELHTVAYGTDDKLQGHAGAIPDPVRQLSWNCVDRVPELDELGR